MIKIFSKRRNIIIAGVSTAVVIGSAGAAFAYFAASGTGTGSATVGAAGTWTVSAAPATGGDLYPGSGTETIVFTVTNNSSGQQEYTSSTAVMGKDGSGFATVNNNPIGNCYAGWFSPSVKHDTGINKEIAAGGTAQVTVTVTMPADETDNQTACAGKSPDVQLNIA